MCEGYHTLQDIMRSKMSVYYKVGDIFKEDVDAVVNTVNCVGVMGRGLALEFKKRYPENFKIYKKACDLKKVVPGKMLVWDNGDLFSKKYVINFPTKRHWRQNSRIEDIESGLVDLAIQIENLNISSIAIPSLGCGLGGLDWSVVREKIKDALSHLTGVKIVIFKPL